MSGLWRGMASSTKDHAPWGVRHARICAALHTPELMAAIEPLSAYTTRHAAFVRVLVSQLQQHVSEESRVGRELDCALALLWGQAHSVSAPLPSSSALSVERVRGRARACLDDVVRASLQPGDFSTQCTLQHGATGIVEIVRCKMDRRLYVLKSTLKGVARREAYRFSPVYESQLLVEAHAHGDERAAFTPQLYAAFQSARSLHILMEYFPAGDLDSLLQAAAQAEAGYPGKSECGGLLQESWVVRYAVDMVAALGWLHSLHFVHRDVKPSNFLLDKSGRLKLCDFATCAPFAYFAGAGERRVLAYYTERPAGTCDYIAPEILAWEEARIQRECAASPAASPQQAEAAAVQPDTLEPGGYGPAVDWWSLGVVLYEMTFGKLPFWAPQAADVYERIAHHDDYFSIDEAECPCSDALVSLIRLLVCREDGRLGRRSTADVQAHRVFRGVPWSDVTQLAPPFVPELQHGTDVHVSVLHSPAGADGAKGAPLEHVGWDSVTMDTPPSFSAVFQGPIDQFPGFDSLDASWAVDVASPPVPHTPPPHSESSPLPLAPLAPLAPPPPPPPPPLPHPATPPGPPSPLSTSACAEMDMHFCAFSYVPSAEAFAVPVAPPVPVCTESSPPPAASTPFTSKTAALSPAVSVDSPSTSTPALAVANSSTPDMPATSTLQRTAMERAYMARHDMHTPFKPSASTSTGSESALAVPNSPYPFPAPAKPLRSPRTPGMGVAKAHPRLMTDTMGSDSRHSGGITMKRIVSERQAWSELMHALERSARKPSGTHPPHGLHRPQARPPSQYAIDEHSPSPASSAPSSPSSPTHLRPHSRSRSRSRLPHKDAHDPSLSASSPDSDASTSPGRAPFAAGVPAAHGELRHKRSTRQLLLDAQVTSTPTRAARSMSLLPVSVVPSTSSDAASSMLPRGHTLRTLRGSASVRDFRTEYMRMEEDNYVLPTLSAPVAAAPAPAAAAPASARASMDSRRMLSEYRRAPRTLNESEDAFGRRTSLTRQKAMPRRMQSTLGLSGLYRHGRPSMASVLEQTQSATPTSVSSAPLSSSPPAARDPFSRMRHEHSHIEQSVSGLEKQLDDLRTRVDKMPL